VNDPQERRADQAKDDEPLRLAPPENETPRSAPPDDRDGDTDVPILLVPLSEESSREIPLLEPLPEEPPPHLPPLFPTPVSPFADREPEPPPEARERRIEVRDPAPQRDPPSLYPLDLPGLTSWLFCDLNTLIWMGATAVLAVILFCGYLLSSVLGAPALVLFWVIGFFLVAAYPLDVLFAAVAGKSGLPDWSDYRVEGPGLRNAAAVLALLATCMLPGLLFSFLLGRYFGLPLLLAGWTVFPSALLLFSASGSVFATNPLHLHQALKTSGWRYILAAAPGYPVLIARVVIGDAIAAPFVLSLLFPAMIAAALVAGTLARENEKIGRRLLAVARVTSRGSSEGEEE
jgi:hypothetical protein